MDCGVLHDVFPGEGACGSCGRGVVVELGGAASADKAMALVAWARRDATEDLESRGTVVGALIGLAIALVVVATWSQLRLAGLVVVIYGGAVGALVGNLNTVRVHRWLRPNSPLQHMINPRQRRRIRVATLALAVLPVLVWISFAVLGGGRTPREIVGAIWGLLHG